MHQEQASVLADESTSSKFTAGGSEVGEWQTMGNPDCATKLHKQINLEFDAAIFYLQYAAYFEKYNVNLPGFAKFFLNAASEEREHGMKLIDYALMRGQKPIDYESFKLNYKNAAINPKSIEAQLAAREKAKQLGKTIPEIETPALQALTAALRKEEEVTKSIRGLIEECEKNPNDYHLVDYLTGEFLEEQHNGQRELAGKIAMLKKMLKTNPHLGDFIFDKQNM